MHCISSVAIASLVMFELQTPSEFKQLLRGRTPRSRGVQVACNGGTYTSARCCSTTRSRINCQGKAKACNKARLTASLTGHYCVHLHQKSCANNVLYGDTKSEKGSSDQPSITKGSEMHDFPLTPPAQEKSYHSFIHQSPSHLSFTAAMRLFLLFTTACTRQTYLIVSYNFS